MIITILFVISFCFCVRFYLEKKYLEKWLGITRANLKSEINHSDWLDNKLNEQYDKIEELLKEKK